MSLENSWKEMGEQYDNDLATLLKAPRFNALQSNTPLKKLKQGLLLNACWGVLIILAYFYVLYKFQIWQVQLCVGVVMIFSIWAVYTAFKQYRNLQVNVVAENSVLQELKRHHSSVWGWMKTQQRVALFIYPVSIAGGFMLGGVVGSGKSLPEFMNRTPIFLALLISIVILTPLCYFLSRFLFRVSFDKHLEGLKTIINELEGE